MLNVLILPISTYSIGKKKYPKVTGSLSCDGNYLCLVSGFDDITLMIM